MDLTRHPLRLVPNRVYRNYQGGALLDRFQGRIPASDGAYPEDWVGSLTLSHEAGRRRPQEEGLCQVVVPGAGQELLALLVATDPAGFLGRAHVARYGTNPAVLVKLLDSAIRLPIQVHPDKARAMALFNSPFGKTESWMVLETRGADAGILMGFRPGITAGAWRRCVEEQDVAAMIDALHFLPVQPGDVFVVEGGTPHAIGAGVFMIEVQEPTDLTISTERVFAAQTLEDDQMHLGVGWDGALSCFHYDPVSVDEAVRRWKQAPVKLEQQGNSSLWELIGPRATDCFGVQRLDVHGTWQAPATPTFAVAIALSGQGELQSGDVREPVRQGDAFFLPASLGECRWESGDGLSVMLCHPPRTA